MASVRKREWTARTGEAKSAWQVSYTDQRGRRRAKQFERKKEADEYRKHVEQEVGELRHVHDRDTKTFAEACQAMLDEEDRAHRLAPDTMVWLKKHARLHVMPELGSIRLNKLTSDRLDAFMLAKHEAGYTSKYLGHMKEVVKKTIKHACYKGWMIRNPLADLPFKQLPKSPPTALRAEPRRDLAEGDAPRRASQSQWSAAVQLAHDAALLRSLPSERRHS